MAKPKITSCQIGDTLNVHVGDSEANEKERNRFLTRGFTLEDLRTGEETWQTWQEIFPEQWHADGNRTRWRLVEFTRRDGEVTQRVIRTAWRSAV